MKDFLEKALEWIAAGLVLAALLPPFIVLTCLWPVSWAFKRMMTTIQKEVDP